jgi:hypothetical protein
MPNANSKNMTAIKETKNAFRKALEKEESGV